MKKMAQILQLQQNLNRIVTKEDEKKIRLPSKRQNIMKKRKEKREKKQTKKMIKKRKRKRKRKEE